MLLFCTVFPVPLFAAEMRHYRMDSYAFIADAIVLCEERKVEYVETKYHGDLKTIHNVVTCKIVEVFKGDFKADAVVDFTYGAAFARYRLGEGGYNDLTTTPPRIVPPKYLPPGRAVMFLKRKQDGDGYHVLTAKLIQGLEVLQFVQFSNPGPYELTKQVPENFRLGENEKYDVEAFLRDLRLAIAASKSLKQAIPVERGMSGEFEEGRIKSAK